MINDYKILAITLARGGSKTIPKKNIIDICGKPLLQYTTDEVKKSKYIDSYFVSTDDNTIWDTCNKLKTNVVKRPKELATDKATSADALMDAVERVEETEGKFNYIIEIMCTNPLKTVEDIDGCIEKLNEAMLNTDRGNGPIDYASVVSVVQLYDHHPSRIKYIDKDTGVLTDFYPEVPESRRQDLTPEAYIRNGSIYAMTKRYLFDNKARYKKDTYPYIMPEERTINIDSKADLLMAEILLKK